MSWYKDKIEAWKEIIKDTADKTGKTELMVERDIIQSILLYNLSKDNKNLIFKGGTCLSKVYDIIDRFSEDLDLSLRIKATESEKKKVYELILKTGKDLGLVLTNEEDIKSRYSYNKYKFEFNSLFTTNIQNIIVETSFYQIINDCNIKKVSSFIEKSDNKNILSNICDNLFFEMPVQTLERTLIDKIFAICDYYLENMRERDSRHIYDICKIYNNIDINEKAFIKLFNEIRIERTKHKNNPSAESKFCINDLLKEIVETQFYESDYNNITTQLLYKYESYDDVIKNGVQKIIDSGIIIKCENA